MDTAVHMGAQNWLIQTRPSKTPLHDLAVLVLDVGFVKALAPLQIVCVAVTYHEVECCKLAWPDRGARLHLERHAGIRVDERPPLRTPWDIAKGGTQFSALLPARKQEGVMQ